MVDTLGTGKADEEKIAEAAKKVFDMRPGMIVKDLNLRPICRKTARYGHFGREDSDFARERTDRADALKRALGNS